VTRRVQWSNDALEDLLRQIAHIAADNPDAAERVAKRIREAGAGLGDFATGHPGRVSGTYEKAVARLPYIIAYALTDEDSAVSILRVIHVARDWQAEEWPE
jgi:plasmid stabilization system protein ParE